MSEPDIVTNIAAQKLRSDAVAQDMRDMTDEANEIRTASERLRDELTKLGISIAGSSQEREAQTEVAPAVEVPNWDELTAANRAWLDGAGMADVTLDDLLTPPPLDELERFDSLGRERWTAGDYVTVGGCAVIGILATAFDDQIDGAVKIGLSGLGETRLFEYFEQKGKNLPIDYEGRKFGGPGHRIRSPGHDLGRPWESLRQIREGKFHGIYWDDGRRFDVYRTCTPRGTPYVAHDLPEALLLWLMHLAADLVTTKSLPLPWWSKLYECDNRELRQLAHNLYSTKGQAGLNVRSMVMSKALPVIGTDLIVGVKVHLDARAPDGTFRALSNDQQLRRDEMRLAAHAVTGLAALGKTGILALDGEGPLAVRHINVPALARTGYLGWKVMHEHRRRVAEYHVPSWDETLQGKTLPWELDELAVLADAA